MKIIGLVGYFSNGSLENAKAQIDEQLRKLQLIK